MRLKEWIISEKLSVAAAARRFGISGVNPGRTLDRIMSGSRQPDADMVARILQATNGEVSASDMHNARLDWLRENRPERFDDRAREISE